MSMFRLIFSFIYTSMEKSLNLVHNEFCGWEFRYEYKYYTRIPLTLEMK